MYGEEDELTKAWEHAVEGAIMRATLGMMDTYANPGALQNHIRKAWASRVEKLQTAEETGEADFDATEG